MSSNQEEKIQKALNDLLEQKFCSIKQAADYYSVPSSTLAHRVRGRQSKANIERKSQRFTNEEERVLVQWIWDLQRQRMSPNYETIRLILRKLLEQKGDFNPLDKHFVSLCTVPSRAQKWLFSQNGYKTSLRT